jgi:hypothetical protein
MPIMNGMAIARGSIGNIDGIDLLPIRIDLDMLESLISSWFPRD